MRYGYYRYTPDGIHVSKDLNKLVLNYIDNQNLDHFIPSWVDMKARRAPSFYNNFEVVNVPYFLQPKVQNFTQTVVQSDGNEIYIAESQMLSLFM